MVELKATLSPGGVFYIPKEIREAFGRHMKFIPNASAVVMFSEETDYEDVLVSLKIIAMDVEHRLNKQRKQKQAETEQ